MNSELQNKLSDFFGKTIVDKAWVFGSFSRNEETSGSDIDIMIALRPDAKLGLWGYYAMKEDLENLCNRSVDLVTEKSLMPFAVESAMNDRFLVYERKE